MVRKLIIVAITIFLTGAPLAPPSPVGVTSRCCQLCLDSFGNKLTFHLTCRITDYLRAGSEDKAVSLQLIAVLGVLIVSYMAQARRLCIPPFPLFISLKAASGDTYERHVTRCGYYCFLPQVRFEPYTDSMLSDLERTSLVGSILVAYTGIIFFNSNGEGRQFTAVLGFSMCLR